MDHKDTDLVANAFWPLTEKEHRLAKWMLENGKPEAASFLGQLEKAEVTPWRCACGCASINFNVRDMPAAPPGVHVLGDFVFFNGGEIAGIFIYSSNGILSGLEVTGLAGEAPTYLPEPHMLMTHEAYGRDELAKK